jgi:hypothetical protein
VSEEVPRFKRASLDAEAKARFLKIRADRKDDVIERWRRCIAEERDKG